MVRNKAEFIGTLACLEGSSVLSSAISSLEMFYSGYRQKQLLARLQVIQVPSTFEWLLFSSYLKKGGGEN